MVNTNGHTNPQIPQWSMNKKPPVIPSPSPAYRVTPMLSIVPPITTTTSTNAPLSLGNGIPLVRSFTSTNTYCAPPLDRNLVVNGLLTALESLKKVLHSLLLSPYQQLTMLLQDFFKPTETTLQKRLKELSVPLPPALDWEEIVDIAKSSYFAVEGEKPNRTIFPPQSSFEGADPNHPRDHYPHTWWKAMQQFFIDVHPVAHCGRYGFALYLKEKGPLEVRDMPLGVITEMVQMALDRQLLTYNRKKSLVSFLPCHLPCLPLYSESGEE